MCTFIYRTTIKPVNTKKKISLLNLKLIILNNPPVEKFLDLPLPSSWIPTWQNIETMDASVKKNYDK